MALSLLSNLLSPGQQFVSGVLASARRFFGNDPGKMAAALSGSPKGSKKYVSQLRTVQRWYTIKGTEKRSPGGKNLLQLGKYVGWKIQAVFADNYGYKLRRAYLLNVPPALTQVIRNHLLSGNTTGALNTLTGHAGFRIKDWHLDDIEMVQPA